MRTEVKTSILVSEDELNTLVRFSKFSPSTAGSHFQWTCGKKLKLLNFSNNWPLSVRCPLTIRARTSGRNLAKFDQRVYKLSSIYEHCLVPIGAFVVVIACAVFTWAVWKNLTDLGWNQHTIYI